MFKLFYLRLSYSFIVFFALSPLFASSFSSNKNYVSSVTTDSNHHYRYYFNERLEKERIFFTLFLQIDHQWQDRISEKSFSFANSIEAESWRTAMIHRYHLEETASLETPTPDEENISSFDLNNSSSRSPLWVATQTWNEDWEQKYATWIKQTLNPQLMLEIKLATDCADVAYALRWIFARINKLPMANRLGGSRQLLTNESTKPEWQSLPRDDDWKKDQRFLAALKYLLDNTYTYTLMDDSYPITISTKYLTPGTHHLELYESGSGHTMIVESVNEPGRMPISLLSSTVPKEIRELIPSFYQAIESPTLFREGFYKIRWAQKTDEGWRLIPAKKIPGYSEMQFHLETRAEDRNLPHFIKIYKLLTPNFNFGFAIEQGFQQLVRLLQSRIEIVKNGFEYCQKNDCSPGSDGDENWSTPSRDRRMLDLNETINLMVQIAKTNDLVDFKTLDKNIRNFADQHTFTIENTQYELPAMLMALTYGLTESSPKATIARRWGIWVDGYGPLFVEKLRQSIETRSLQIQKAQSCRDKHCTEGDSEFLKWSTAQVDADILKLWNQIQNLCGLESNDTCLDFDSYLKATPLKNRNAWDWSQQIFYWKSNPNISVNSRWNSPLKFVLSSSSEHFEVTKDKQWISSDHRLFRLNDRNEIKFSNQEQFGQLHFQMNTYFTLTRVNKLITIQIYEAPITKMGQISMALDETCPIRVWWSGPNKKTLSLFTCTQFNEIDLSGQIINSVPILHFHHLETEPAITIMATNDGLYFSDANIDAAKFIKLPILVNDIPSYIFLSRSSQGWAFGSYKHKRTVYVETNGLAMEWPSTPYEIETFLVLPNGQTILRTSADHETTQVWRRQNNATTPLFSMLTTIPGYVSSRWSNLGVLYRDDYNLLNLETLLPVRYACPKTQPLQLHPGGIYSCLDDFETTYFDSKNNILIGPTDSAHIWHNFFFKGTQLWASRSFTQQNLGIASEYFKLEESGPTEPLLQYHFSVLKDDFARSNSDPLLDKQAPSLNRNKANLGLVIEIQAPSSFLLSEVFGVPSSRFILFDDLTPQ